jgi:hypothetical protein
LNLLVVTPAPRGSRRGNRVTALRWAGHLRALGHRVRVAERWTGQGCDALVALHATRSHPSILAWRARRPRAPLVVGMAGTDLYQDLPGSAEARRSLALATRITVLQPLALEALPGVDRARLERLRSSLRRAGRPVAVPILASDRNAGALRLARKNAEAAGVAGAIRFERCDAALAPVPPGPGLCATNPPYGRRLDEGVAQAWRALGALLSRLGGWDVVVLAPDRGLEKVPWTGPSADLRVRNGGVACRICIYRP